jgi:hypothetical protein
LGGACTAQAGGRRDRKWRLVRPFGDLKVEIKHAYWILTPAKRPTSCSRSDDKMVSEQPQANASEFLDMSDVSDAMYACGI